jgi:hypothetical protein
MIAFLATQLFWHHSDKSCENSDILKDWRHVCDNGC